MAIKFNRSQTFATGGTVTSAALHNLIDGTDIYPAIITDQSNLATISTADKLLIADTDDAINAKSTTVQNLFDQAFSGGTYTALNLTGNLTYGTATGNRTVSTSATITTGTINNATLGTTTSTAATITTGTIPSLTAGTTTSTAASITNGTIATLNSTTGTIGNLSTTLAGDLAISQGTATLGTSGVTAGTYGGSSSIPTIVVDAKGRVTTASTSAVSSGLTGFRNRIINGDMRIDQRNAGASVTQTTSVAYNIDRWFSYGAQTSKFTVQQNAGSITPPTGFSSYIGMTSLSSYSVLSGDLFFVGQYIEGFNFSDLSWGTANAKPITISFWVRSSLTGTFGGGLQNSDQNRSYPFSFAISSANTWEQKTITIAGDTSGTWVGSTNGIGLRLFFSLGMGSSFSGTSGAWVGTDIRSTTGAVSVVDTNGATFYITGVQLEAGSTATDFERRPYGVELALCQRYAQRINMADSSAASGFTTFNLNTTQAFGGTALPVPMRASPTITFSGSASDYQIRTTTGGFVCTSLPFANDMMPSVVTLLFTSSGLTAGQGSCCRGLSVNASMLAVSEL